QHHDRLALDRPVIDDTHTPALATARQPPPDLPQAAASRDARAELRPLHEGRLQLPIHLVRECRDDLPREHRGLDDEHQQICGTGVYTSMAHIDVVRWCEGAA